MRKAPPDPVHRRGAGRRPVVRIPAFRLGWKLVAGVGGTVEGRITAHTSVKILSTGRVYGDIFTPALIIEYGAVFDGKCSMAKGAKGAERDGEEAPRFESKSGFEKLSLKVADAGR